jgi:hypothetical protein
VVPNSIHILDVTLGTSNAAGMRRDGPPTSKPLLTYHAVKTQSNLIKQQATLTLPSVMRSSSDWLRSMSVLAAGSGGNGVVPNSIQYSITPQLQMSKFPNHFYMNQ